MKSFFNFLRRNKLYSAINIFGFSISIAFVMLLAIYAGDQFRTDAFHANADRTYLVCDSEMLSNGYYMSRHLRDKFPEIEAAASYSCAGVKEFTLGGETLQACLSYADSSFFDIFSFPLESGSLADWKSAQDRVLLSASYARKLFGGQDPVGKSITMDEHNYIISGVFADIKGSAIKSTDIIMRGENLELVNPFNNARMSDAAGAQCFVMTCPGIDLRAFKDEILDYHKEIFWVYKQGFNTDIRIIPLREIYFKSAECEDINSSFVRGNWSEVLILLTMSILLLVFAILNYVNMTTAISGLRAKETATRRLVGASGGQVFLSSMRESWVICAVATVIAALLAQAIAPAMSRFLNYHISVIDSATPLNIGICLLFTLAVSLLSGLAPSLMIQRVNPIEIVRGSFRLKTKTLYSKVIIVVQNVMSIVMLVVVITMSRQISSMIDAPLGYDISRQLTLDNNFGKTAELAPLIDALESESCIEAVGLGIGHPLTGVDGWTMEMSGGKYQSFKSIQGDAAYFDILGIRVKRDNRLTGGGWWFNEQAFREAGIPEDSSEMTVSNGKYDISGIYCDFRCGNILDPQSSIILRRYADGFPAQRWPTNFLIRYSGNRREVADRVSAACARLFPGKEVKMTFLDTALEEMFADESRVLAIMRMFTLLSILVSTLGLIAMSSYYMQQERRTVSLKKVFGADPRGLLLQLVLEFVRLVGVAFGISVPLSWGLMDRWLQNYSYHIALSWWIFALAGIFAAVISALAVLHQSVRAANTNPVEELKKE